MSFKSQTYKQFINTIKEKLTYIVINFYEELIFNYHKYLLSRFN